MTRIISGAELRAHRPRTEERIVDVRPLAAYNGWRLDGEGRGGHIPGAVAVPIGWLDSVDAAEFERILDERGLSSSRRCVIVYGLRADDATPTRRTPRAQRERPTSGCSTGDSRRGPRTRPPVEAPAALRPPRPHRLAASSSSPASRPEAAPSGPFLLFHVNFGVPEEYAEGHIPGALYLDTNRLEDPADWNRRSPEVLDEAMRALGITQRHDRHRLRPRHRRRCQREVARPAGRPDRRDARAA